MRTLKSWVIAWCLVVVTAQFCSAAGFAIYEWGARDMALGGATVGRADDPAALSSNPAGITQLEGVQVTGGILGIHPVLDVEANGKSETSDEDALYLPPHFYATWKVNDRYSLGLATFSRFGLGTVFDDDWEGRYNSYEATMESVSVNPNMALKFTDSFSAAFGVEAMYLNFNQKKKINLGAIGQPDGDADIEADGFGYGFNMALHYQPCQYAKVGLSYRSPITMKVTGDADFSSIPSTAIPVAPGISIPFDAAGAFKDTSASGVVTLPDSFAFGVAMYPMDKLSVEVGAIYTLWSKYDELKINFGDDVIPVNSNPFNLTDETTSTKNWDDVWRFNVGVEYAALDWLDLRLGYVYDNTPVPDDTIDYLLPDSDRQIFSTGLGFHKDNWAVDVNYSYLLFADRDIDGRAEDNVYDGEVTNADCHIAGVSFTYKF
jgi:long-chain fatty acid transport protein